MQQIIKVILYWLVGFMILLGIIVVLKHVVFEYLQWNGTTKNDWVYILWWIVVFAWGLFGIPLINKKTNKS